MLESVLLLFPFYCIESVSDSRKYLTELRTYCNKIKPFVSYYSKLIHSYNTTAHNILQMKSDYYYLKYQDKNVVL